MLVLALDTSSLSTSCALCELAPGTVPRVLAESLAEPPARTGDVLPQALLELCERAGLMLNEVQGLCAGIGPGSFTGLRVGLAAAKAIAYARRLPLASASSLRALALAAGALPQARGRLIVPTLEARRAELYAELGGSEAAFRAPQLLARLRAFLNERSFSEAEGAGAPAAPLLVGPGAAACRAELLAAGLPEEWLGPSLPPAARAVAQLCSEALLAARYDQAAVFSLAPNYVKPSEAEVALAEGRVGGLPKKG